MNYKHLTTFEIGRIEMLNNLEYSSRYIAEVIGRHYSTIVSELARNENDYKTEKADVNYHLRRTKSKPKCKCSNEICDEVQTLLLKTWSLEQIANTAMKNKVSFKTIYNWLYSGVLSKCDLSVLRQKR